MCIKYSLDKNMKKGGKILTERYILLKMSTSPKKSKMQKKMQDISFKIEFICT